MKYIAMTCQGREWMLDHHRKQIPELEVAFDHFEDTGLNDKAYQNFIQSLEMADPEQGSIHMEDDIFLTRDFKAKAEKAIAERPDDVIQFFSMRKKDLSEGSRYEYGRTFCMNQCFYLPAGMAGKLATHLKTFNIERKELGSPYDIGMADTLL